MRWLFCFCMVAQALGASAQYYRLSGTVRCGRSGQPLRDAGVWLQYENRQSQTDAEGRFVFDSLPPGDYQLTCLSEGFASGYAAVSVKDRPVDMVLEMDSLAVEIGTVTVSEAERNNGLRHLRSVEGMSIYAAKKNELIDCSNLVANLANNNPRQLYAKVAGLNIWENDNSGIQLNIGARGLDPNRTSNFNTRQNGYDISADALGYPESYYTPPGQALQRIEIVRGAASLQYGSQFGGLLNFVLQRGAADKKVEWVSETTYGANNFASTFNSLGGTVAKGRINYYGFYLYKRGDGWRPHSGFDVHDGYASLGYTSSNERFSLRLEQTLMHYKAQQPGGLTDAEFGQDARQSKRLRNWFAVDWRISSLHFQYQINKKTKIQSICFLLDAGRRSLGNLQPINRPDYGKERDLIKGRFLNIGNETRLMHHFRLGRRPAALLLGSRLYRGHTLQQQGYGNADSTGRRSDFEFLPSSAQTLRSDYRFPSFNAALFAEQFLPLSDSWSLTPGIRYEYIYTGATGYYQDLLTVQGQQGTDTLKNEKVYERRSRGRHIALAGLGLGYRPRSDMELYANFSQNYRAINFNDMRIVNPNQVIDSLLRDEKGFNADLGFRGSHGSGLFLFDVSMFYLSYQGRIGSIQRKRPNAENPLIMESYNWISNIGNARVFGIESLLEADVWRWIRGKNQALSLVVFVNFAWLDGRYTRSANSYAAGNRLEFVSPITLRTGITVQYKGLRLAYQYAYTHRHFSDATNALSAPNAVVGLIPSYGVMDLTLSYTWRWLRFQCSLSNMADARYFTRRAASYPGPGILPADGFGFFFSVQTRLGIPSVKK